MHNAGTRFEIARFRSLCCVVALLAAAIGLRGQTAKEPPKEATRTVVLMVTPRGVYPSQLKLTPGPVSIIVITRTGHPQARVNVLKVAANRSTVLSDRIEATAGKTARPDSPTVLTAGEYQLAVEGRQGAICTITVAP